MKNSEKFVAWVELFIVVALVLWGVVFSAIQCVAETRVAVETIKSGKVPVGVYNEK